MNSKRIALALVLAVAIAGVVSYAFYSRVRSQQAVTCTTVKVVAATKPLSAGSPISADSVALIDWPSSMPLSGAYAKVEDVIGRSIIYPIDQHQPILEHDVALAGSGIGLTVKIPEGMRAVSVRSNDVVGVAGFLYPGSRVDVLVTSKVENSPTPVTQTVLPNVEVLVAGQKIEPDPTGKPETVNVVTLLLKPEDGEKLVLASSQGSIQFVLRNGADQKTPETRPVNMADLMTGTPNKPVTEKKLVVVKAPPRVVKPAVFYEVETIAGSKRLVDKFE
ncbi:MAG TPA: Flp pilus assembly protein CpaB [Candidatus Saccharimonadales bacterium]|nr:Flp pilus assembly protein CpaB [Candidatus Saccharimonadales bacterium]